ncbi:hypothetical protein BCY89_16330 [Sphingobacterium siyangense]|uniref:Lipoprotein n=2 Tax=Sphingobacterium TaxID=28453 RepID=A0ABX7CX77_SPHMU|nr:MULTISPECIES: hypothetical protein [Sphingobacterium]QQT33139.1 hypothetical protein I6I99_11440 [Sphingobacterium multivorum]QQT55925.1 hypothetical protein I6I98_11965 [Sphingobacterium multivorum]QRY56142.1 hypothetical protein JVX97_19240 [Sphingobacterium siyangense]RKF31731.1 hypothetical protein BCY89_16330 [Sphingobacterium siyangense]
MKKIIVVAVYCVVLFMSCNNRDEDRGNDEVAEVSQNGIASVVKSYFLYHEIRNVDYAIYINDVLAGQSHENDGIPGPYKLNQYITSSGKQIVKMIISANSREREITPEILGEISKNAGIYLLLNKDFENIKELKKLQFPHIEKSVPSYECIWEFEAD